ncbi:MAG: ATP-binding cassette domain-containing protein, partial [Candidatus Heimdallarchaeaceae archaeon]
KSKPTASSISETKVHYNPLFKTEKKKTYALRGISLNISEGEIFGLLGPNGAGKTTLTKIISTLIIPDKGNIFVNDLLFYVSFSHSVFQEKKQARREFNLLQT